MKNTVSFSVILCLMLAGVFWLWHQNQEMSTWPGKKEVSLLPEIKSLSATERAEKTAKRFGITLIREDVDKHFLQSEDRISVSQFNQWFSALMAQNISPSFLQLEPADGEGYILISAIRFQE